MKEITGSIYGAEIQTCQYHGIPYIPRANTTLNENLEILPNIPLNAGEYPTVGYFIVGMGGHRLTAASNGKPKISAIKHRPEDAGLYEIMPLVLRLESDDLTPAERAKYGLRKKVTLFGKNYFAYYAKKLDLSKTESKLYKLTVVDGVKTVVPFVPTSENLHPSAPIISPEQVVATLGDGNYLTVQAVTTITFTELDIAEYQNAVSIMLQDPELAVISEVGLISGVGRDVDAEGPGGSTIRINELGVAQLSQTVSTYENLNFANAAFDLVVNAGMTKSMLTES